MLGGQQLQLQLTYCPDCCCVCQYQNMINTYSYYTIELKDVPFLYMEVPKIIFVSRQQSVKMCGFNDSWLENQLKSELECKVCVCCCQGETTCIHPSGGPWNCFLLTHSWSLADCLQLAERPFQSLLSWCCSSHLATDSLASDPCGWKDKRGGKHLRGHSLKHCTIGQ